MIKNERQYRLTKAAASRFQESLERLMSTSPHPGADLLTYRAEREAIKSQLDDLQAELRDYEALSSGRVRTQELGSLAELPRVLVRARIASGMSQRDLAQRLHLKEQQIQRYEATDYRQASLARLIEVADVLHIRVDKTVLLPTGKHSVEEIFGRLRDIGLTRDFVLKRLVPREATSAFAGGDSWGVDRLVSEITSAVTHVFHWSASAMWSDERPWLDSTVMGAARFKVTASAEQKTLEIYTFYAHFMAMLLLKATEDLPHQVLPSDPDQVHAEILTRYGDVSFRSVLLYCWDLGVPVLPLNDPGAFHGACWRVEGRNVIVLKQRTRSLARWLFDLLHEYRHAAETPQSPTHEVVEHGDTSIERRSDAEQNASWFAGDVSLGGRAEELVAQCVEQSQGSIERLKSVVPEVARAASVETGVLANYLAFRLSLQGQNWWGAATNLQPKDESPWGMARDVLLQRVNFAKLTGLDRQLFVQCLEGQEM